MSAKKITRWCACALAALLACLVPLPASAADPVRIMALGDSITGSPGCRRALSWQHLRDTGRTNTGFVGTLPAPGRGFTYDSENEGHVAGQGTANGTKAQLWSCNGQANQKWTRR